MFENILNEYIQEKFKLHKNFKLPYKHWLTLEIITILDLYTIPYVGTSIWYV